MFIRFSIGYLLFIGIILSLTSFLSECKETADIKKLNIRWNISLKSPEKDKEFISYRKDSELLNITGVDLLPDFSGYIKYEGEFNADSENAVLNLGYVGQTAHLYINGNDMGIRVTAPYSWDASGQLKKGINKIEIIAANTPANRVKDRFSYLMPIPPSGGHGIQLTTERILRCRSVFKRNYNWHGMSVDWLADIFNM